MRLWIDVIRFRFESSRKKNKKRIKTKKEFTRFMLNKEGKLHLKTIIKLVRPTLSISVLH